jgi:hypothetical protein
LQPAQQSVQAAEVAFPNAAVSLEPDLQLLKRLGTQGIDAALGVDASLNESSVAEDAKVLGNLRLVKVQTVDQVADGAGTAEKELDDLEAVGFGEGSESGKHGSGEYAS